MPLTTAYIALGSNQGDRMQHLRSALRLLQQAGDLIVSQVSPAYENRAIGMGPAENFFNAVVEVSTSLSAEALLARGLQVEDRLGRVRTGSWAPRTMDVDLLLYGATTLQTERLHLPHPRITERDFVLCPWLQIAPQLELHGRPLAAWVAALPQVDLRQLEERICCEPSVCIIAAVAENQVIGRAGQLPWSIAEDWSLFMRKTRGGTLLMGRQTFSQILQEPGWAEDRDYIVITSQPESVSRYGVRSAATVDAAMDLARQSEQPIWICGGEAIYRQALAWADQLHLTQVHAEVDGDRYFPDWSETFKRELGCARSQDDKYSYTFKILER